MKQSLKMFAGLSLLVMLSLVFTGLVSAETVRGQGWLHAQGSGTALLKISGTVEINGQGVGAVYIYGAETIQAEGNGRRVNLAGGGVVFRGYSGALKVEGERMRLRLVGGQIDFTAEGQGVARLHGQGTYETGGGLSGQWNEQGVDLEIVTE